MASLSIDGGPVSIATSAAAWADVPAEPRPGSLGTGGATQLGLSTAEGLIRLYSRFAAKGIGSAWGVIRHAVDRWMGNAGSTRPHAARRRWRALARRELALGHTSRLRVIATAIDGIAARMRRGGRLIYVGAGTSGRLGVLDAAECPATFGTSPGQVVGVIAGGASALAGAIEDAEDDEDNGARQIADLDVRAEDSVVGITASGRTPFVLGALREAR